jgi:hypothetical protein
MKSKKFLTILLSLAIMVTFMPVMAFAQDHVYTYTYTSVSWASDFHSATVGVKTVDDNATPENTNDDIVTTDSFEFQYLDPKGVAATKAEYTKDKAGGEGYTPKMFVKPVGAPVAEGATPFRLYVGKVVEVGDREYAGPEDVFLQEAGAEYKWIGYYQATEDGKLFGRFEAAKPALAGELQKDAFDASTMAVYANTNNKDKLGRYVVDAGAYSAWYATKGTLEETSYPNPVKVSSLAGWNIDANTGVSDYWTITYPAYDAYEFDTVNGKAENRALEATITLNEAAIKAYYGSTALVGTATGTVGIVANVGTPNNTYFTDWYLEDNDTYNKDFEETYDNKITYDAKSHGIVFKHMPKNVTVKYYVQKKENGKAYVAPKDADWVDTFPGIKDSGTYYVAVKFIAEKSKVEYVLPGKTKEGYTVVTVDPYEVKINKKQNTFEAEYGKLSKTEIEAALAALFEVGEAPDSQDKVAEAFQKYLKLEGVFEDAGSNEVTAKIDAKKLSDDTELAKALSNYTFGKGTINLWVEKAENNITIKTTAKTVKGVNKKTKKLKKNKNFNIAFENEFGTVQFTKEAGNGKITVSKDGKVTVKKGIKKGTYKLTVSAYAKGTANYTKATATKTIKVTVK